MATFDVFTADGFTAMEMTEAINLVDYKPQFLGGLNFFRPNPVRTTTVAVESRGETLALIQSSERGAPRAERSFANRELRDFRTRRIEESSRLKADELRSIRAFGSESELEQVAAEINRRQILLIDDIELTMENLRLGAIQGIVTDADASVIVNYFTSFGISQPAEIAFDLANTAAGALRGKVAVNVVRPIRRAAKGLVMETDIIYGLCGDAFFDEFVDHAALREVIQRSPRGLELLQSLAFDAVDYGGVRWVNYRGTDDNSTVAIGTDLVKFFPASPRVFEMAWSPGESFDMVNMPGMPLISRIVLDKDRNEWADIEVASYPLPICKRPHVLLRGKRGA